jgi:glycosyltransferase involved in cell wall biosynthesis
MYKDCTIAVVVPAYNEEKLIGRTISTMPDFVDEIVVVDDCSTDGTVEAVKSSTGFQPVSPSPESEEIDGIERIDQSSEPSDGPAVTDHRSPITDHRSLTLLRHDHNQGVGGAIVTGYKYARDHDFDVAVVMAGDAQMDPDDLPAILDPVVEGEADYSKGNRLFTGEAWKQIPKVRYLGNSALSLLTKIASGYWHVADSQTGYTAINRRMLRLVDWDQTYKRYGCPNDYLVRLNVYDATVADVPVQPVYNIGEKSGIKLWKVIPKMSWLLGKLFLWRMLQKYVIRDFHPLVFFYGLAFVLLLAAVPLTIRLFWRWAEQGYVPSMTALACFFSVVTGLQSLFFAMWFDMEHNKHLK